MPVEGRQSNRRVKRRVACKTVSELIGQKHCCVEKLVDEREIALSPRFLGNLALGLKKTLEPELFSYSEKLSGLPMSLDKIVVDQSRSRIVDSQPELLLHVKVSFLVFKPEVGKTLLGIVNKIGDVHIGCLVHDCFNARIYQSDLSGLYRSHPELVNEMQVEKRIVFRVKALRVHHDLLLITGDMDESCLRKMARLNKSAVPNALPGFASAGDCVSSVIDPRAIYQPSVSPYPLTEQLQIDSSPRKKKTKLKIKTEE